MNFIIDPAVADPILASVSQPAVTCVVGLPFNVRAKSTNVGGDWVDCPITGLPGLPGLLKDGAANEIHFTFSCNPSGVGLGVGSAVELGVAGSVVAADFQNAAVGGYSDSITFQIAY